MGLVNNTAQVIATQQRETTSLLFKKGQMVFKGSGKRTPRKTGRLRRMTSIKQIGEKTVELLWAAPYAAVQQAGKRSGARPFKKYTTGGTGPGFVEVGVDYASKGGFYG